MPSYSQRSRRIINGQMLSRFLLIGTVVVLQACSAIKLAYNNAPEFGFWWLDAYADFNDTQAPAVRTELARLLQWHRSEELPKIAELLQKTQRLAAADVTPAAVCDLFSETRARFTAVTGQAEKATATLALSLPHGVEETLADAFEIAAGFAHVIEIGGQRVLDVFVFAAAALKQ